MPNGPPTPAERPDILVELDTLRRELAELAASEESLERQSRLMQLELRLHHVEGYALALLDAVER